MTIKLSIICVVLLCQLWLGSRAVFAAQTVIRQAIFLLDIFVATALAFNAPAWAQEVNPETKGLFAVFRDSESRGRDSKASRIQSVELLQNPYRREIEPDFVQIQLHEELPAWSRPSHQVENHFRRVSFKNTFTPTSYLIATGEANDSQDESTGIRHAQLLKEFIETSTTPFEFRTHLYHPLHTSFFEGDNREMEISHQNIYFPLTRETLTIPKFIKRLERQNELKTGQYFGRFRQLVKAWDKLLRRGWFAANSSSTAAESGRDVKPAIISAPQPQVAEVVGLPASSSYAVSE